MQVDFLENNSDYEICFHNCEEFLNDNSKPPVNYCNPGMKTTSNVYDLILSRNFIPTSSVVQRNRPIQLPNWLSTVLNVDWVSHIFHAQFGKIYYINKVMSRHRLHSGGASYITHREANLKSIIETYLHFDTYFDKKYHIVIKEKIAEHYHALFFLSLKNNKIRISLIYLFKAFMNDPRLTIIAMNRYIIYKISYLTRFRIKILFFI